jgi:predicted ArsR family transcriptional regulator
MAGCLEKTMPILKICLALANVNVMQLPVLKALADETRYAVYRELSTSTRALSAQDLADRLGVHANTVRLHLERLREVGIIDVEAVRRGRVGRPQHLYFLADGAPGIGFDPPAHALLAGLLASLAERVGADPADAADAGRAWGVEVGMRTRTRSCVRALEQELQRLGFEPAVGPGDGTSEGSVRIEFLHCPFRELAEAYPELVCNLHRGLCEGVVEQSGTGRVDEFATLYDPEPCHVTVGSTLVVGDADRA